MDLALQVPYQLFDLDPASLVIGLLGFNIGVEFGQLAVIAIVFTLTLWLKDEAQYRKLAVIPVQSLSHSWEFIGRSNAFSFKYNKCPK